jgi:acid stress chaperone HdeA
MLNRAAGTALCATVAIALVAGAGLAQTSSPTTTKAPIPRKPLSSITCQDFTGIDETFKPRVIAWAAGYQQGRKTPDQVTVDLEGVEKIMPVVVDACTREPQASFWQKVEGELRKIL